MCVCVSVHTSFSPRASPSASSGFKRSFLFFLRVGLLRDPVRISHSVTHSHNSVTHSNSLQLTN